MLKKRKIGTVGNPSLLSEYARRVSKEILKEYLSVVVSLCEVLVCLRMCLRVCMARQKRIASYGFLAHPVLAIIKNASCTTV